MEHNMYKDMMDCQWFKDKVRNSKTYAQNLYAAMCNMQWQKRDVMPILKDELWSCTWRGSGGIVAEIRACGEDYMDYYCSGMGGVAAIEQDLDREDELEAEFRARGHVPEGEVTPEICADLLSLGWQPVPYDDDFV